MIPCGKARSAEMWRECCAMLKDRVLQIFSVVLFLYVICGGFYCLRFMGTKYIVLCWLIANLCAVLLLLLARRKSSAEYVDCFEQHMRRYGKSWRLKGPKVVRGDACNGKCSVSLKGNFVSLGEYCFVFLINLPYNYLDFPLQLIRSFHEYKIEERRAKSEFSMNSWIDVMVVASFSTSGFLLWFLDQGNGYWLTFFAGYFVWRIVVITISKLRDITSINIASRNRTIFIYLVNIADLVFCYSYLYLYFDAVDKSTEHFKLDAIVYALRIFTTQGVDDPTITRCAAQDFLIISQMFVFIILFIMVVTNLFGLKEGKKEI